MTHEQGAETQAQPPRPHRGLVGWWRQGARSAFLLRPHWQGLQATPGVIVTLVLVAVLVGLLIERLYIRGAADFHWPSLLGGWLGTAVFVWVAWWLVPRRADGDDRHPPSAAALVAMWAAQTPAIVIITAAVLLPAMRNGWFAASTAGAWAGYVAGWLALGWVAAAQIALVWHSGARHAGFRVLASLLLAGTLGVQSWVEPTRHWVASGPSDDEDAYKPLKLTQEMLERQPQLLRSRLDAIAPQRPGSVDMFAITFAPYAAEGVFQRESALVAGVMDTRFGSAGKSLQLVNHRSTVGEWPWATPLNLQRAIRRFAEVMDPEEDVLFIHLTSHGARAGELAAEFWPLEVGTVTPQLLKAWLDEAGVRFRVISVSACYSGSWIDPLASPGTLVMTAADAHNTSYGCGRGSQLTYFGRAMFDEQLRHTRSFEQAHAAARRDIEQREREAGKDDGYSNPQLRMGDEIRRQLAKMEEDLP